MSYCKMYFKQRLDILYMGKNSEGDLKIKQDKCRTQKQIKINDIARLTIVLITNIGTYQCTTVNKVCNFVSIA